MASTMRSSSSTVPHLVVIGGNGFVGQALCQLALLRGYKVTSVNRSGKPKYHSNITPNGLPNWPSKVEWIQGDCSELTPNLNSIFSQANAVVSCVGGFASSPSQMEKINGRVNEQLFEAVYEFPKIHFVGFSSCFNYHKYPIFMKCLPAVMTDGYLKGKRNVEKKLIELTERENALRTSQRPSIVPKRRVVITQSTFIYGDRKLRDHNFSLPLGMLGKPFQMVRETWIFQPVFRFLFRLPMVGEIFSVVFAPPVNVKKVAEAFLDEFDEETRSTMDASEVIIKSVDDINHPSSTQK